MKRILVIDDNEALLSTLAVALREAGFADVAVYLDEHGEICRDPYQIARSDDVPATFPFLVSEMRVM